jgi:hypothetical protein
VTQNDDFVSHSDRHALAHLDDELGETIPFSPAMIKTVNRRYTSLFAEQLRDPHHNAGSFGMIMNNIIIAESRKN